MASEARRTSLGEGNLLLTKLRILLRLSHKMAILPHKQYEHASRKIDEVGRMLGAWGKADERMKDEG